MPRTYLGVLAPERDNQPTAIAADGKTVLKRYRVDGVIYARTIKEARERLDSANIYLDDAIVVPSKHSR